MENIKIANIFREIADILEMKEVQYKPRAYRKAAMTVESLSKDIEKLYREKGKSGLKDLSGVGENISEKIIEIIETGDLDYYRELKEEVPVEIEELMEIPSVGPKTVKKLYKELEIKNRKELKKAAKEGKVRELEGFGEKSEKDILEGINFVEKTSGRHLLGKILPIGKKLRKKLEENEKTNKVSLGGSIRRKKATIGDIDILITSDDPKEVMDFFTNLKDVEDVIGKGETKTSVRTESGFRVDLRIVEDESFGSALQYFTGNKSHNIELRKIALDKGYKLNEYGVFEKEDNEKVAGKTEEGVYQKLGLELIPPELRQNREEIEASKKGELPDLIERKDINGDLHIHTKWSDGNNSIKEIAEKARKEEYSWIGISDHAGHIAAASALSKEEIRNQWKEIEKVNEEFENLEILKGIEVDLDPKGNPELAEEMLEKFDFVIGGVHSKFKMNKEKMTERIEKAMRNDNVDIITHPTGRKIGERESYDLNIEKLYEVSKEEGTYLEIDAQPNRLDLKDTLIKKGIEENCKLIIGSDAHDSGQLKLMNIGISNARRGWCEKEDILNTLPVKKLLKEIGSE